MCDERFRSRLWPAMKTPACLTLGICLAVFSSVGSAAELPDDVRFETHVRPILKANCFHCHGEEDKVEGKLDLRLARLILSGGDGGPAIVVGDADQSLLVQKLASGEMP